MGRVHRKNASHVEDASRPQNRCQVQWGRFAALFATSEKFARYFSRVAGRAGGRGKMRDHSSSPYHVLLFCSWRQALHHRSENHRAHMGITRKHLVPCHALPPHGTHIKKSSGIYSLRVRFMCSGEDDSSIPPKNACTRVFGLECHLYSRNHTMRSEKTC